MNLELSPREYNVLKLLLHNEKGMTIESLAEECKVSIRSLYDDIKHLKKYLRDNHDIEINKKGKLFFLEIEDIQYLLEYDTEMENGDSFSNKPRKMQIIEILALMKTTTMQQLADQLYVSKSTINQDMKSIEKFLSKFSIHVAKKPYHGMMIQGSEMNIRFLLQYLISEQMESVDLNLESMMYTRHFMINDIYIKLKKVLEKYPDLCTVDILICLSVMIQRIQQGHLFYASEMITDTYDSFAQLERVKRLLGDISNQLGILIPSNEVYYLMINIDNYDAKIEDQEHLHNVLDAILHLIQEKYQDIKVEQNSFYMGLLIHISTMLKRIKFGKVVRNPVLDQTKESLPFAFNIAADIAMMLNGTFNIYMNEDETGLLAMHIQAMMEEERVNKEVRYEGLIASHIGYGNARMISSRLFSMIPELNIKHQVSIEQLEELWKEKRIDNQIIISTYPLTLPKDTYVLVHPILIENDIDSIKTFLKRYEAKTKVNNEKGFLSHVLTEHIYINQSFKTKEKLLSYVCDRLYEDEYVTEEFYNSTLAREAISSTYALNGVALPHGYSKCVLKPGIAVVILDKPLDWDGYYAEVIFVCALSLNVRENDQRIFEDMYSLLNDREVLKKMKECGDSKKVIEVLKTWNKGEKDED